MCVCVCVCVCVSCATLEYMQFHNRCFISYQALTLNKRLRGKAFTSLLVNRSLGYLCR